MMLAISAPYIPYMRARLQQHTIATTTFSLAGVRTYGNNNRRPHAKNNLHCLWVTNHELDGILLEVIVRRWGNELTTILYVSSPTSFGNAISETKTHLSRCVPRIPSVYILVYVLWITSSSFYCNKCVCILRNLARYISLPSRMFLPFLRWNQNS